MAATVNLRGDLHARIATAHVESAHAFGSVDLVPGERSDIDIVGDYVERYLAHNLHRIGVEDDTLLMAEFADFANRLKHADLVVGRHDGDENRLVVHGALQVFKI